MIQDCEQSVEILKEEIPAVSSLRDVTLEHLHDYGTLLSDHLYRRNLHVITANDRVLQATEALGWHKANFLAEATSCEV